MRSIAPIPQPVVRHSPSLALFGLMLLASMLFGYSVIAHLDGGIGDEDVHRFQINWFINGHFEIFKYVTMIPTYHAIVAGLAKVTSLTSLNGLRFVHLLVSLPLVFAMFRLVRIFYPDEVFTRTLMLVFIPFVFPLFFLTYTDLLSLASVLLMLERTWSKHYVGAALLALFAVLVRQPNVIWVAFAACVVLLSTAQELALGRSVASVNGVQSLLKAGLIGTVMRRCAGLSVVLVLFVVFVFVNGGVAVGDAEQHHVTFNLSNLYFYLLVAFVLFLPYNIEQFGAIKQLIRDNWWILAVLLVAFLVYFNTYNHAHKYNTTELSFYRHNLILHYTCDILPLRIASFVPMAWMALSFVTALRESENGAVIALMLFFAVFAMVPLPLIEQRYYFVPLTLFLVLRPRMTAFSNLFTLTCYIILSAYILYNISNKTFFL